MTLLSPSNLETADYNLARWQRIYNKNIQLLNTVLLKISALGDVDTTDLIDGSYLQWNASTSTWEAKHK